MRERGYRRTSNADRGSVGGGSGKGDALSKSGAPGGRRRARTTGVLGDRKQAVDAARAAASLDGGIRHGDIRSGREDLNPPFPRLETRSTTGWPTPWLSWREPSLWLVARRRFPSAPVVEALSATASVISAAVIRPSARSSARVHRRGRHLPTPRARPVAGPLRRRLRGRQYHGARLGRVHDRHVRLALGVLHDLPVGIFALAGISLFLPADISQRRSTAKGWAASRRDFAGRCGAGRTDGLPISRHPVRR